MRFVMIHDFFLVERALQLQRLRAIKSPHRIDIPGSISWLNHSSRTTRLFRSIDKICEMPLDGKPKKLLGMLLAKGESLLRPLFHREQHEEVPTILNARNRTLLLDFEKNLVRWRLGDDPEAAKIASEIISSILHDREHFLGLKPLAFHSENIPYECLFPSWLNLYTALVLPIARSNAACYSEPQMKTVFEFLDDLEGKAATSFEELNGALTLAARRLPPPDSQRLIQRIIDLCCCRQCDFRKRCEADLSELRERAETADEYLAILQGLVVVEANLVSGVWNAPYCLTTETPRHKKMPAFLASRIQELRGSADSFGEWAELIKKLGRLLDSPSGIVREFYEILKSRRDRLTDWLALILNEETSQILPSECQKFVAGMIRSADGKRMKLEPRTFRGFAQNVAPRLEQLDKQSTRVFYEEFIELKKKQGTAAAQFP